MAARSTAQVNIILGMVTIGVKFFLSASAEQVSFNMINPKTGNRVKQLLTDAVTNEELNRGETLKGYEYQKDKYLTFTDEEIANMQAEKRDTLDIVEFVPVSEIDPLYVEKTYYTGPDKGMDRQYQLLYQILKKENKAAVGTWIARGKEHLVTIRAYEHGLIIHQMFYNSEVRAFDNTCDSIVLSPAELALGNLLVQKFSKDKFDKSKYRDKFSDKLNKAIKDKLSGNNIKEAKFNSVSHISNSLYESLASLGVPENQINALIAQSNTEKPKRKIKKTANG